MEQTVVVISCPKRYIKTIRDLLKDNACCSESYDVTPQKDGVLVPVSGKTLEEVQQLVSSVGVNTEILVTTVSGNELGKKIKKGPCNPEESGLVQVKEFLSSRGWTPSEVENFPPKWIKYGDIILLFSIAGVEVKDSPQDVLDAFNQPGLYSDVRCILIQRGVIQGELRKPVTDQYTLGTSTETIHVENSVKYKFDVQRVMYSPGNGTERIRIARLPLSTTGEIVVDMFCGLGYFSLPLAKFHPENVQKLIAIEKNPTSFHYLQQNVVLNKLSKVVFPVLGDNREVAREYEGAADRILMGYLPNTYDYIESALKFAKTNSVVNIHYHHLCQKEEFKTLALQHFNDVLERLPNNPWCVRVVDFVKVKSYAPKIFHCCADLQLYPRN
eukprot:TRINITY_DN12042_c0_g1_i1.p1 TRINITY_DN12042_c0_g1~~TRINITY_DN12042_c0_g1_i1.p1  ORF type:complete len:385 (+),score=63.48 TRINITY_DN12042_c0_g1_i1:1-1155(+)